MGSAKKKFGVVFSHDKCNGCLECEKACVDSHKSSVAAGKSRLRVTKTGDKYKAAVCLHCETCPPSEVCPSALLEFHDDKRYWSLDEHRCFACMACIPRCSHEAVFFEGEFGIETAYMCDLCLGEPKCVAACKPGALRYEPSKEE